MSRGNDRANVRRRRPFLARHWSIDTHARVSKRRQRTSQSRQGTRKPGQWLTPVHTLNRPAVQVIGAWCSSHALGLRRTICPAWNKAQSVPLVLAEERQRILPQHREWCPRSQGVQVAYCTTRTWVHNLCVLYHLSPIAKHTRKHH